MHEDPDKALPLVARTLALAPDFDELLFTDLLETRRAPSAFLGTAIPVEARAVCSFLLWLAPRVAESETLRVWDWARERSLVDGTTAGSLAWALWNRRAFAAAERVWSEHLGRHESGLLNHPRFETEPLRSPREWILDAHPTGVGGAPGRP